MRRVNGIIAAFITVFFLGHALLGALSQHFDIPRTLTSLMWLGIVGIAAHVALSALTSRSMLKDEERPPSDKKKRHLLMKWVTGAVLLVIAALHGLGVLQGAAATVLAVCLAAALAVHVCFGSKSLLKDLGIDRRYRLPLRIGVCALAALASFMLVFP